MGRITDFLHQDHARCDELYLQAERLAANADVAAANNAFGAFAEAMNHHFAMEEQVLFPTFEDATGSTAGPTAVMRHEHEQMRGLFADMAAALSRGQADEFLAVADTLLVLMQQHNAKEERILYPMSDRMLADAGEVIARMQAIP
ncbi:MAG: hemerythrin domain-containing protein [Thiohalomonadaceae bacterium]